MIANRFAAVSQTGTEGRIESRTLTDRRAGGSVPVVLLSALIAGLGRGSAAGSGRASGRLGNRCSIP